MKKIKVIHIAPHVGEGVGTVVFSFLREAKKNKNYVHKLCILGYADERTLEAKKEIGFSLKERLSNKHRELLKEIQSADLVLIHWWNHPLLSDFLIRCPLPPSRVVIWCHISGSVPPNNLTKKILKYPDIFVFTTPLSYKVSEVKKLSKSEKKNLHDIWSTAGTEHLKNIKPKVHDGFHVGYIGNVGHGKMHPDFLKLCKKIKVPNIHFTVIGGYNHEKMKRDADALGMGDTCTFTGFISGEEKWALLATFDVFGYPLQSNHHGSCDQVLQEAMAVGAVPVVLNNPMESLIVENGVTGIVAKSLGEYVKAIEKLYKDTNLRKKYQRNGKKDALRRFSIKKMCREWEKIFVQLEKMPKKVHRWDISKDNITPVDIFLETLGTHGTPFVAYRDAKTQKEKKAAQKKIEKLATLPEWQSESKSTVHNFNSFLPRDNYLSEWSRIMHNIA